MAGELAARPAHGAPKVIVTSDHASLPDGCRPRQIAEFALVFIDAFNNGNREQLVRLFFKAEGPSPPAKELSLARVAESSCGAWR